MNKFASVFIAEATAILLAIYDAKSNNITESDIYSDSESVLRALSSAKFSNNIIDEIKKEIRDKDFSFYFHWIKAHIGHPGNELADCLAREAVSSADLFSSCFYSIKKINNEFNKILLQLWQKEWSESQDGRPIYEIFPQVTEKRALGDFYLNQLISGHGMIPMFQNRLFGRSEICLCGEPGDINHVIFHCSMLMQIREKYDGLRQYSDRKSLVLDFYGKKIGIKLMKEYYQKYALVLGF